MKKTLMAIAATLGAAMGSLPGFGMKHNNVAPPPARRKTDHDLAMLAKAQAKRDRKAGKSPREGA